MTADPSFEKRSGLNFVRVSQDSAADAVRRQLIEMIESGQLAVGDRLPAEVELARDLGVSRNVVREALVSLRILGFTSSRSGSGTFVASDRIRMPLSFGGSTSEQLNEVRRHLEVPCAGLAARRRSEEDLAELARIVDEFEAEDDPRRRVRIDSRFHVALARATANPLYARLIEDLRAGVEEQSLAASLAPGRRAEATTEHRDIYKAVRAADVGLAEKLMMVHLDHLDHSMAILAKDHQQPARAAHQGSDTAATAQGEKAGKLQPKARRRRGSLR
jgi:DNA-binding FadR family transcriptional regulator